ncbi:MAG: hypothetical protein ABI556_02105 [Gemmatimonadales bacterium]
MTRSQFAMAVMADEKWIENTGRLLNRRLNYSVAESVWLGLVRMLTQELQVPLNRAAELADEALGLPDGCTTGVVAERADGNTAIVIDMARFRSSHTAALSAALTLGGARRRGRQRVQSKRKSDVLEKASRYGVDVGLLREGLKLSVGERLQRADENAAFIRSMRTARS